jgi:hypothetical protein
MHACLVAVGLTTIFAGQDADVASLVASARQALGGDAALTAITSFTVDGSLQRSVAQMATTERFQISCLLPDRFLRESHRPMGNGPLANYEIVQYDGFDGVRGIRETASTAPFPMPPPPSSPTPPATTPDEMAAAREKQLNGYRRLFIEMATPMFVSLPSIYGLQLSRAGKEPLAKGQADVIEIKRADGAVWRLLIDDTTHLPAKLTWRAKPIVTMAVSSTMTMRRGDPSSARGDVPVLPSGDPTAGLSEVDWETTVGDYQTADGLTWPHRLTTTFGGKTWEDVRLGKFKINPKIDPKIFQRGR